MIQGVLFDIDDTLVDYSNAERAGIERYLRDLGVPADTVPDGARHWREVMERHFARYLDGELSYLEHRRERARDMLRWLAEDVPSDPDALDEWFAGYRHRYEQLLTPYGDVLACLDALTDLPLGVVTNNDTAYQRDKLARAGVADRFRCVIGTDLAGCRKPEPGIFLAGCRALGTPPGNTLYVGDRLDDDARGALAAGLVGVWLCRTGGAGVAPDVRCITDLAELPELLRVAAE
ncbi:MAG: HAD family hydrolase [Micromonosporaceae bacterium]